MAIYYKVSECTNPSGAAGVNYATNREVKSGDVTIDDLCEDIEHMTSVTRADAKGIITAYMHLIQRWVSEGIPCEIQGVGTFYPAIKSKCFAQTAISQATFNPSSYIEDVKLRFRANANLLKTFRTNVSYKRLPSDLLA